MTESQEWPAERFVEIDWQIPGGKTFTAAAMLMKDRVHWRTLDNGYVPVSWVTAVRPLRLVPNDAIVLPPGRLAELERHAAQARADAGLNAAARNILQRQINDAIDAAQAVVPDERREWLAHWLSQRFAATAGADQSPVPIPRDEPDERRLAHIWPRASLRNDTAQALCGRRQPQPERDISDLPTCPECALTLADRELRPTDTLRPTDELVSDEAIVKVAEQAYESTSYDEMAAHAWPNVVRAVWPLIAARVRTEMVAENGTDAAEAQAPTDPEWRATCSGGLLGRNPDRIEQHNCGCVTGWDDAFEQCVLIRCGNHRPAQDGSAGTGTPAEALEQISTLHRPVPTFSACNHTDSSEGGVAAHAQEAGDGSWVCGPQIGIECEHCRSKEGPVPWPCPTAKLAARLADDIVQAVEFGVPDAAVAMLSGHHGGCTCLKCDRIRHIYRQQVAERSAG